MIAAVIFAALMSAPKEFGALPLPAAVQDAVANSPDVEQARQHVNESASLLAAARSGAAPALIANYAQAPQGGNKNNTITQRLTTVGAQVTVGDYLIRAPLTRQAEFALDQARFDLIAAEHTERVKAIGLYYSALRAWATLQLRRTDDAGAGADLRAAQIRFKAGDAPRLDVVRAQVALAGAQAALDGAQVEVENRYRALEVETGTSSSTLVRIGLAPRALPEAIDPHRAVTRALAFRGDLSSANAAVKSELAAVAAADRGVLPSVTVNAGYTRGVDSGITVGGPSANVNLTLPVSHAASYRAQSERFRMAAAQARVESIKRQIAVETGAAARTYAESIRAAHSAAQARAAADEELRATQTGYRNGASSSLDVADARRTYVTAALNELDAVYAQAQSAALLEMEMEP
ncbi:MAG: TolC family protein [Candidatus Baltobacteraceae bacterium]